MLVCFAWIDFFLHEWLLRHPLPRQELFTRLIQCAESKGSQSTQGLVRLFVCLSVVCKFDSFRSNKLLAESLDNAIDLCEVFCLVYRTHITILVVW